MGSGSNNSRNLSGLQEPRLKSFADIVLTLLRYFLTHVPLAINREKNFLGSLTTCTHSSEQYEGLTSGKYWGTRYGGTPEWSE